MVTMQIAAAVHDTLRSPPPLYTPVGYFRQEERRTPDSRRHLAAAFRKAAASFDAILHIAEFLATLSASLADFGAKAAHGFMLFRADQHEIGGCLATLGASQHEPEVRRLHMLSARDEPFKGVSFSLPDIPSGGTSVPMQREMKEKRLQRLARIEGQVRGIARMVGEDRYCIDILTQIAAVQAALRKVESEILQNHVNTCVEHAITSGNAEEQRRKVAELMEVLNRSLG
jgi:DNA-binding FrmR family transcriptional regulator